MNASLFEKHYLDILFSDQEWINPLQESPGKITVRRNISVLEGKSRGRDRRTSEKHANILKGCKNEF